MKIAVLDIQGSVIEHVRSLEKLDIEVVRIKKPEQLNGVSGLIIPGGESTTISKLLKQFGLFEKIKQRAAEGMAVWGTCAGAILLAKRVVSKVPLESLGLMDICVERNAYGAQLESFETTLDFLAGPASFGRQVPAIFIRAPKIGEIGEKVEVLARDKDGAIVAAREDKFLATSFHPELSEDLAVHEYFVEMCKA